MKRNQKIWIGVAAALLVVLIAGLLVWQPWKQDTVAGSKIVTVEFTYGTGVSNAYVIHTDAEYLAEALLQEGIIKEIDESGYYTTFNDVTADYNADKSWWKVTKDGEMTSVGINEQPILDGERYEITYTTDA